MSVVGERYRDYRGNYRRPDEYIVRLCDQTNYYITNNYTLIFDYNILVMANNRNRVVVSQ